MATPKKQPEKARLHPRNRNRERYDLGALVITHPELAAYVHSNKYGDDSIDFSNPIAVKMLNKALLHHEYGIKYWEFPDQNLCPPIPGRADYIHHVADLLCDSNNGTIPTGDQITCLDIGVGANCIYPIIGVTEYDWQFIASDIDPVSIASAQHITDANPSLSSKITCKLQENPKAIFYNILSKEDFIDVSICNPPFHSSAEEARKGTQRKIKNLSGKHEDKPTLNFAGVHNELICEGGESRFINTMIRQSVQFATHCYWFTTLVSKEAHLKGIYRALKKVQAQQVTTIPMGTGNKSSRIVAWTFLSTSAQQTWKSTRWTPSNTK